MKFILPYQRECELQNIVPPPPPGSPPPHLLQPKLKDPDRFIVKQLLYFHYDLRVNEMIVTPTPHLMMPMMKSMTIPPPIIQQVPPAIQQLPSVQPVQPYPYKTSTSSRHHSVAKASKSNRSSSSKHYHSSHKPIHASNETNLIVLSSSPSNT